MKRIYFPGKGLDDWKQLLASPTRQWKQGYSAFELAMSWELAAKAGGRQLPKCVVGCRDMSLSATIENLRDRFEKFKGSKKAEDDVSLLLIEF